MELGDRHWGTVGAGSQQSSQDGLGEHGVSSSGEESEQLHEKVVVKILGTSLSLVPLLISTSVC